MNCWITTEFRHDMPWGRFTVSMWSAGDWYVQALHHNGKGGLDYACATATVGTAPSMLAAMVLCERYAGVFAFVSCLARLGEGIETRDRCDTCGRHSCYEVHEPARSMLTGDVLPDADEVSP